MLVTLKAMVSVFVYSIFKIVYVSELLELAMDII